ncbi:MAG: outer membrane beta-barrel protein [Methylacidiphilales bacterium]|nr:outer membrane beta-barrel protein [Candidatus Methylacidiphilales bacterium]
MTKQTLCLCATLLISSVALADTGTTTVPGKDLGKTIDKVNYVETDVPGVRLNGYVDVGYTYNFIGAGSQVTNRFSQDSHSAGDFNVNAVKLTLEKPLSDKNELQAGFRVDAMLGEDAAADANDNYSTALLQGLNGDGTQGHASSFFVEQAYVTIRVPYGNGIDFKVGKQVSWLGYEAVERPSNLNITYGNLFQNMTPLSGTGVSAEYKFCDIVDAGLKVTNGWDADTNGGQSFDIGTPVNDGYAIEAKLNIKNKAGNANIQQSVFYTWDSSYLITRDQGVAQYNNGNAVVYDVWGNWAPKCTRDKLLLGFNTDLGFAEIDSWPHANDTTTTTWWGAALYAKYQFNSIYSLAARADYIHTDDSGQKFGAGYPTNGGGSAQNFGGYLAGYNNEDIWSLTLTNGFNIVDNLLLRAEYRVDIGDDVTRTTKLNGFGNPLGTGNIANTVSVEAVYTF